VPVSAGQWVNEQRMKTSVNAGEESLPPERKVVWDLKASAEHGCGSEKQVFEVEKMIDRPSDGRKTTNIASNGNPG